MKVVIALCRDDHSIRTIALSDQLFFFFMWFTILCVEYSSWKTALDMVFMRPLGDSNHIFVLGGGNKWGVAWYLTVEVFYLIGFIVEDGVEMGICLVDFNPPPCSFAV